MLAHPCKVQLRSFNYDELKLARKIAEKFKISVEEGKTGLDIYFEDVNEARRYISKLKKILNFILKMSTEYAGLRKGRVRVLFVYSLRGKS